ncbi:MAG: hypothetical protein LBK41_00385 [Clostridiales bacterium]|nr:hypothetical protein [Clostridiales bacterium]
MKRFLQRAIPTLTAAVVVICGGMTAFASTVDALHNGQLPAMPTASTAPPTTVPIPQPTDVQGIEENGVRWIVKTYELAENESADRIPRESFELDSFLYECSDVAENEIYSTDEREHTEAVTINADTKNADAIMKQLAPTLDYEYEDGYAGVLALDISTIDVESAGTRNESYTVSETREYSGLTYNDPSLIPKAIVKNGRTLTLQSVSWRSDSLATVDYSELSGSYIAIAEYSATASKTVVTGYVATAEYKGIISKNVKTIIYTAYFAGTLIATPTPEPTATPAPTPTPVQQSASNPVPVVAGATAGAGLLGGVVFFFLRRNVKVHNLKDGKYTQIGKTRISRRNPVINLTPFADRVASGSFILVLDRLVAKSLSGRTVSVNYGDKSFQHIIDGDGGEYQFEVDF